MRRKTGIIAGIILFCMIMMGSISCWKPGLLSEETPVTVPEPKTVQEITLTAVGDCLMHNTQIWSGEQEDGTYNFDTFFADVEDLIKEGDYSSTCFEAPMAGPETGYTGYPTFNSPDEMAETFKKTGFDLINTAHNHAFDRGYKGAMRTLQVLKNAGLDTVGSYASEEESKTCLIKDIKGIKVGYLAYSYGTNGLPVPEEHSYCFNLLDQKKIVEDIKALRPQVDVLILILHWGTEYMTEPHPEQVEMAHTFLAEGADAILGSHPHVIQPMEVIKVNNKNKFVIYSMGNFISNQNGLERNSGIVLNLKFAKNLTTGETELQEISYTPTYSHYYFDQGQKKFRVVAVERTLEDLKKGEELHLTEQDIPVLEEVLATTRGRLGQNWSR